MTNLLLREVLAQISALLPDTAGTPSEWTMLVLAQISAPLPDTAGTPSERTMLTDDAVCDCVCDC